jgi:hypothetical protein
LVSGGSKSCGRKGCKTPGPQAFAFGRAVRTENKAKEKLFVDDRWWYVQRLAMSYVKVSKKTLFDWKISCPWLDGKRGIDTLPIEGAMGRIVKYYAKDDLDLVIQAKEARPLVPKVPGHIYIMDALRQTGLGYNTFLRRMKAKKVEPKKVNAHAKDGRALPRSYIPSWFVKKLSPNGIASANGAPIQSKDNDQSAAAVIPPARNAVQKGHPDKKIPADERLPENKDVLRLAKKINDELPNYTSQRELAIAFCEGNITKADSLLRQLRRFPQLII